MRKHINDKIGEKHEENRKKHNARNGPWMTKDKILQVEMAEISKRREILLKIRYKVAQYEKN
jgi:hypothetical protein